jgi:hypothetical protein
MKTKTYSLSELEKLADIFGVFSKGIILLVVVYMIVMQFPILSPIVALGILVYQFYAFWKQFMGFSALPLSFSKLFGFTSLGCQVTVSVLSLFVPAVASFDEGLTNLIMMGTIVFLGGKAKRILKSYGVKIGFWGVSKQEIEALRLRLETKTQGPKEDELDLNT